MSQLKEESLKKIVGLLISVLGGEYSDSRDLAIVQLVQLSPRSIQYLNSYLLEESDILKVVADLKKVASQSIHRPQMRDFGYAGASTREESLNAELEYIEAKKEYDNQVRNRDNEILKLVEGIESKYKISLGLGHRTDIDNIKSRAREIVWPVDPRRARITMGVLEVIGILGEQSSLPILRTLSYDESRVGDDYDHVGDGEPEYSNKSLNNKIKEILNLEPQTNSIQSKLSSR